MCVCVYVCVCHLVLINPLIGCTAPTSHDPLFQFSHSHHNTAHTPTTTTHTPTTTRHTFSQHTYTHTHTHNNTHTARVPGDLHPGDWVPEGVQDEREVRSRHIYDAGTRLCCVWACVYICVCIYIYMCVCVCECDHINHLSSSSPSSRTLSCSARPARRAGWWSNATHRSTTSSTGTCMCMCTCVCMCVCVCSVSSSAHSNHTIHTPVHSIPLHIHSQPA
jgi:hypothetical protein